MDHTYIKVRSYHLDGFAHVNNARYLEFLEEARWAYFDQHQLMAECERRQIGFIVVNINISFKKAALADDELDIHSFIASIGSKSIVFRQTIYLKGTETVVCAADITLALVSFQTEKAIAVDEEIRLLIER